MTIKPEDLRKHLETRQDGAGVGAEAVAGAAQASAAESLGQRAAALEAAKENAILESISASYFGLRRGLAALAFALPILLWLGAGYDHLQGSISAYYHFFHSAAGDLRYGGGAARDILVGVLCAAGAALYFYKGYGWKENLALNIAGFAAILLALAPMDWPHTSLDQKSVLSLLHTGAAVVFFLAIAYVCLFCSGETLELMKEDDERRRMFKRAYTVLGALMIVLPLTVVGLDYLMPDQAVSYVTFAIEVVAIYVFATFWVVKSWEIAIIQRQ